MKIRITSKIDNIKNAPKVGEIYEVKRIMYEPPRFRRPMMYVIENNGKEFGVFLDECEKVLEAEVQEDETPKYETVDVCRIMRVVGNEWIPVHTEEIIQDYPGGEQAAVEEVLKEYKESNKGEYIAVHEVITREKKGE